MDRATLDREQPWRVAGNNGNKPNETEQVAQKQENYHRYAGADTLSTAPTVMHCLNDIPGCQRELHNSTVNLGMRLANIVHLLNGYGPSENPGTLPSPQIEENAPFSAIIARTLDTQQYVSMCAELVNMIEVRLGIV